ncbi:MAG: hypothetical protein AAF938_15180 [Myxococcota bacterium]
MAKLFVGAQVQRPPKAGYAEKLPFAELVFPTSRPKASTLAKWRRTMPDGFAVALVAPRACVASTTPYKAGEDLDAGRQWLREACASLDALLVLPNYGLTTSRRDRTRLGDFVNSLADTRVVWAPGGLWEPEQARPFAAELGIDCAVDPLKEAVLPAERVYARMAALGARQRFSEGILEEALDAILEAGAATNYVAIASPRADREAANLIRIASM